MKPGIQRVLLDLDGVLVDFIGGACRLHGKTHPYHPHSPSTQEDQSPWAIEPTFNMGPKELWDPLGEEFWANLLPLPHFRAFLGTLEAHFGPDKICILTAPPRTKGSIDGKIEWIRRHMPDYRRRFMVGPAKEFCAGERHVLIDDHEVNIAAFRDAGGHGLLVPAPWNHRFRETPMDALKTWLADQDQ